MDGSWGRALANGILTLGVIIGLVIAAVVGVLAWLIAHIRIEWVR